MQSVDKVAVQISRFRGPLIESMLDEDVHGFGFAERGDELVGTLPAIHRAQNRGRVALEISPGHVAPQAVAQGAASQPVQHGVLHRPRLHLVGVRLRVRQTQKPSSEHGGDVLQWIRAQDHGLDADEHGKNAGLGALPSGCGWTFPGPQEAKADCLVLVVRRYDLLRI